MPPAWIGTRNGSASTASTASRPGRRAITTATAADGGDRNRRADDRNQRMAVDDASCGECQMSASSSTGASTSAPSIASARSRPSRASRAHAASTGNGDHPQLRQRSGECRERDHSLDDPLQSFHMSCAKLLATAGLAALLISACGTSAKPVAGSIPPSKPNGRGKVDDPRIDNPNHVKCLQQDDFEVTELRLGGLPSLQIGTTPTGPTVMYEPTAGAAQGAVMQGLGFAQSAEVIGSALLFPNQASDAEMKKVETCIALGILG